MCEEEKKPKKILELGAGKHWKKYSKKTKVLATCVDSSYERGPSYMYDNITLIGRDIFKFLEKCNESFDDIIANRVFEHIDYDKLPYLFYLCKEVLNTNGELTFTVPDFSKILEKINEIDPNGPAAQFNRDMIDTHTELFNTPKDPHRSIWTKTLVRYYVELEDFWKFQDVAHVTLDNRDWYMRVILKKK